MALFGTIADSGDGVILLMAAFLVIDDSLVVQHEGVALSIDTDAGWLLSDGSLQLGNTLLWNSLVAGHSDLAHGLSGLASLISSFVWIVRLERDFVLFSILEGPDLETTIATFIALFVAVNEMLL